MRQARSALLASLCLMCTSCARAAGFGQDQHQHHLLPLDDGGTLLRGLSACLPMRLRGGEDYSPGGRSSLAGTGRVADLWDVHKFSTRDQGMVAVFRHHALGTALELCEANLGMASFVENDTRNASVAMAHGRVRLGSERRNRGYTPLVRDNRTWWDLEEGFLAPDTLEALRDEAGSRPMVAEWFDVGEGSGWEAFDDGSQPHVHITNSDAYNEIFLTANGFIFVGAPAGPEQPHKPQAILVENGSAAQQISIAEGAGDEQENAATPASTAAPALL